MAVIKETWPGIVACGNVNNACGDFENGCSIKSSVITWNVADRD